jgi:hypothetical protein
MKTCRKIFLSVLFSMVCFSVVAQFKLYEKGHDSYAAGKYDEAISLFSEYLTKVTRDKNMDVEVYYLRALSYYKKNNYEKAIGDFEETLLQNHKNRGNIHWFKAKCHEKLAQKSDAIDAYTSALRELDSLPDSKAKLLVDRGRLYEDMGEYALAIQDFQGSLAIAPNQPVITKEIEKINKEYLASRGAVPQQQNGQASNAGKTPVKGDKKPSSTQPQQQTARRDENKNIADKKNTTAPVTTPARQEDVVAKNDAANKPERNQPQQNAADTNGEKTESKSIGQRVKNVAGKVGDKVSDTFKGDGKTEQSNKNSQASNQPVAKPVSTPANTPAVVTQDPNKPLTLADQYADEKRYALIIGNSTYPKSIGVLRNPVNDAADLAKELQASNFEVQLLTNATYGQMRAAMLKFKDKIDAGDKDKTVSLFYFAGHGLQYEDENYLVPVDAMIEYQDDISRYCFGVQKMVLANMERSNSRMNIVILDACRNNPFPAVTRSMGNQGLGEMRRARGSFIAYATAPGSVASDGTGRNGLYTQELLKAMRKPGLTIEQVFKEVRANVLKHSDDKQNTWDSSNIIGEFYFKF